MTSQTDELRAEMVTTETKRKNDARIANAKWLAKPGVRERQRERVNEYNKKNLDKIAARRDKKKSAALQKALHKINKERLVTLMGGKCSDCGVVYPTAVYDFHHTDPGSKESIIRFGWKWTRIETEARRCVLLCSNCHRIRHI